MKIESLDALLQNELRDLYDCEKRLMKALPKLAKAASSPELREAFQEHLEVTKGHVQRLEEAFEMLGTRAKAQTCPGIKGIIEEGEEMIDMDADEQIHDAALVGAAQRAEHYEIAAYGTVRTIAEHLGKQDIADLMQSTLDEEKEADDKLSEIGISLLQSAGTSGGGAEPASQGREMRRKGKRVRTA
jgi:ferritin-like metal-binding protein YciE